MDRSIVWAIVILGVGVAFLRSALGSDSSCGGATGAACAIPSDGWEPFRLGFALVGLVAGSSLLLSSLWKWRT